ncbi:MAG: glycosyltransferase involved in cell wall biosynthesis [Oceanicoccus sp.]|jgi:glycosyltransferase involved in cell wall biosynthesis
MPLRIAVDARPLALPMVGITRYTFELLQRLLVASPHEWFLYLDRPSIHPLPDLPNVHIRAGNCQRNATSTLFAQWFFPRWAKQDQVDIFWSPRHHLPLLLASPIKTLVTIHDLVWHFYPETMSTLGRYLEKALMPLSVRRADKVIAVSQATSAALMEVLGVDNHSLQTIPLASHFTGEISEPAESAAENYFLFVGTLEPRKNLQRLLQAFAKALNEDLSITTLKIVGGNGWGGIDIEDLARDYGLENNIELLGRVDNEQLQALYQQAYALLMPSLYEGFGLPLLESMGFGVPVISSNVSSMPEVVGKGGLLVDPLSVDEIANALLLITLDQHLYSDLTKSARKQAGQYSWDATTVSTLAIIDGL